MEALIKSLAALLTTDFDTKTVGAGGDFGALLTRGPYPIYVYFHQWEDIHYPSINVQIVSESFAGEPLECCGGGVMALLVDFRISVDSKKHGWSIASALHEALREWLCEVSGTADLIDSEVDLDTTPTAYTYVATIETPTTYHMYEGEVFSMHVMARVHYVRQEKGEFSP